MELIISGHAQNLKPAIIDTHGWPFVFSVCMASGTSLSAANKLTVNATTAIISQTLNQARKS